MDREREGQTGGPEAPGGGAPALGGRGSSRELAARPAGARRGAGGHQERAKALLGRLETVGTVAETEQFRAREALGQAMLVLEGKIAGFQSSEVSRYSVRALTDPRAAALKKPHLIRPPPLRGLCPASHLPRVPTCLVRAPPSSERPDAVAPAPPGLLASRRDSKSKQLGCRKVWRPRK